MQETWVPSLDWQNQPKGWREKGMATHSSILAWRIPWTEEPGRLQSMGSPRVRHDWATFTNVFGIIHFPSVFLEPTLGCGGVGCLLDAGEMLQGIYMYQTFIHVSKSSSLLNTPHQATKSHVHVGNPGQQKLAWTQSNPMGDSSKSEGTLDDRISGCGMVGWATSHRYKILCCREMPSILGHRLASTEALSIESLSHPSCIFGSTRPRADVPAVSRSCPPGSCVPPSILCGTSSSFWACLVPS